MECEHVDVYHGDHLCGLSNNVVLDEKKIIICEGSRQYANDMFKRGFEPVKITYYHRFHIIGSGIHSSSDAIHRES